MRQPVYSKITAGLAAMTVTATMPKYAIGPWTNGLKPCPATVKFGISDTAYQDSGNSPVYVLVMGTMSAIKPRAYTVPANRAMSPYI
jgi:hypothetical protein